MLRLIGVLILACAGYIWWRDMHGPAAETPPRLVEFGEVWFNFHKESLIGLQSGLENRLDPEAFQAIEPVLYVPFAYVIAAIGFAFVAVSRIRRRIRALLNPDMTL